MNCCRIRSVYLKKHMKRLGDVMHGIWVTHAPCAWDPVRSHRHKYRNCLWYLISNNNIVRFKCGPLVNTSWLCINLGGTPFRATVFNIILWCTNECQKYISISLSDNDGQQKTVVQRRLSEYKLYANLAYSF